MKQAGAVCVTINDTMYLPPEQQFWMVEVWTTDREPNIGLARKMRPKLCRDFSAVMSYAYSMYYPLRDRHHNPIQLPYYLADKPYAKKTYRKENIARKQFNAAVDVGLRARITPMFMFPDRANAEELG